MGIDKDVNAVQSLKAFILKYVIPVPKFILESLVQPSKAYPSIFVTELGIVISVIPVKSSQMKAGISEMPSSKVTLVILVHPEKGWFPQSLVKLFGINKVVKPVQFLKASNPILVIVFGKVIPVILVELANAVYPKEVTFFPSNEDGIVIFPVSSETLVHFKFLISLESFNSYDH